MPLLIDGFIIDAAITEEHTLNAEVTSNPVEEGSDVTDHVRLDPDMISIEGVVSDSPMPEIALARGDTDVNGAFVDRPSDAAFAHLIEMREKREPVTVVSLKRTYENMICTQLSIPVNAKTGEALRFRATFQQIQIVTNERRTIRVATERSKGKAKKGAKAAAPVTPPPEADEQTRRYKDSFAGRIYESFTGPLGDSNPFVDVPLVP
jgi:hypothetical protein